MRPTTSANESSSDDCAPAGAAKTPGFDAGLRRLTSALVDEQKRSGPGRLDASAGLSGMRAECIDAASSAPDKPGQSKDIQRAIKLAKNFKE